MTQVKLRPGADFVILADFESEAAWKHYAEHPLHLRIIQEQLLPITEHPYGGSWGYQVGSYFAPTARLGSADDFRFLVDQLHSQGLGVLLDWVPAHFPKDDFALGRFDGTALYEHADPLRREQPPQVPVRLRPEMRRFDRLLRDEYPRPAVAPDARAFG